MTLNEDGDVRRYLLGEATADEQRQVEEALLRDDEYVEWVLLNEDELINDYIRGALSARKRELFEKQFLLTTKRREKLEIARSLIEYANARGAVREVEVKGMVDGPAEERVASPQKSRIERDASGIPWWRALVLPPWKVLAYASAVALAVTLVVWRPWSSGRSEVERGMAALNQAYRDQRLIKVRVTGLQYAPYRETRGGQQDEGVDLEARKRAGTLLDRAVEENPSAAAHHALGRFYLARKNFDDAIMEFEAALKMTPNDGRLHSDLGAALLEKGIREAAQGGSNRDPQLFGRGLEHLQRALDLDNSLLEALFNRALLRQSEGRMSQAKEDWELYLRKDPDSPWAEEAKRNLRLIEEQNKRAARREKELFADFKQAYQAGDEERVWHIFSRSHFRLGNSIAGRLIEEALSLSQEGRHEEARGQWQVLSYVGSLSERRSGDRYTADLVRIYQPSSAARAERLAVARGLMRDAYQSYTDSHLGQAIDKYAKAKRLFLRHGNVGEALLAEVWSGVCHLQQADTRRGLASFNEVVQASDARVYKWLSALALNGLANAQTRLTEYSSAIDSCRRAHDLAKEIADENGSLRSLNILSGIYDTLGNFRDSWRVAQEGLQLAGWLAAEPSQMIGFYYMSAQYFNALGLYASALDYARETLRLGEAMNSPPLVMSRYLVNTGLIYGRMGRYAEATEHIELGMKIGQNGWPEPLAREMTAYAALFLGQTRRLSGAATEALAPLGQAADFCREKADPWLTHMVAKEQILTLVACGDLGKALDDLGRAIARYEESRSRILEEGNRNSFFAQEQSIYDIAISLYASRLEGTREAFEYSERSRARSLLDAFRGKHREGAKSAILEPRFSGTSKPLRLDEIQARMPERVQLLQYAALDDKLVIWVVTPQRCEQKVVNIPLAKLSERVTGYLTQISRPSGKDQEWQQAAKELYDLLFRPILPLLEPDKQLCIVPDKVLNHLPYGALIPSEGRFLIEDHLLSYAPSASLFVLCTEAANDKSIFTEEHLLSVGNPSFDRHAFPHLDPLPEAAEEAVEVAKFYRSARVLIEWEARKEAVLREMEQAEVIHLAMHYDPDPASPLLSRLVLAAEPGTPGVSRLQVGALSTYEVYRRDLRRARLAVLSACKTWAEDYFSGEGAVGVSRPFVAAGIPLVISTLWQIYSPATKRLMIDFHSLRKHQNLSTAEALRGAQLSMLRGTGSVYRHPHYWAPFIVIGGHSNF